jgi:hypothetical protein
MKVSKVHKEKKMFRHETMLEVHKEYSGGRFRLETSSFEAKWVATNYDDVASEEEK